MPTERNNGKRANEFRRIMTGYLKDFSTTVTLVKKTKTYDGMNRLTGVTEVTSTIRADIQWLTKKDLDHINAGNVQVGDGMLFTEYDADIDIEDEVEFGSERYKIDSQVEGEQVEGSIVYKGFLIKRNTQ